MAGTGSFETTEFRRTFHQETDVLLRQRILLFIGVWGGLWLISFAMAGAILVMAWIESTDTQFADSIMQPKNTVIALVSLAWIGVYAVALFAVLKRRLSSKQMLHLSMVLIAMDGVAVVVMRAMGYPMALPVFLLSHFVGCVLFPWTIRQSLIPLLSILALSTISLLTIEGRGVGPVMTLLAFNLLMAIPAIFVSGFKHSQRVQKSTNRFLNQRYGMLRQELAFARQVHESLFPGPVSTGPLRFAYKYEPMRQIGGDYLYARQCQCSKTGSQQLSVVVLDVTGHGIPAALTVNRLHGEIDLQFASCSDIGPGEMLAILNRYINLTLSKHSIYATAICLRVDLDKGVVQWASGGHPPAFILGVDGTMRDLSPTSIVLGAHDEDDFEPNEQEIEFTPGDSMIAYTDGAIEARDNGGKMIRIDGLRQMIASFGADRSNGEIQGTWSERILNQVATHREGLPPDDDTLIIEIFRPIGSEKVVDLDDDPDTVLESVGAG